MPTPGHCLLARALHRGGNDGAKLLDIHRFGQIVERACLERLDRIVGRAISRDDDAALPTLRVAQALQQGNGDPEAALHAGAAGFLPKTLAVQALIAAVRLLASGGSFAPMAMLDAAPAVGVGTADLTRRERDVLRGVCDGKSNKEIARDLEVQEVTIKLHVKTLTRKLGARNRTHAAMIARNLGLIRD